MYSIGTLMLMGLIERHQSIPYVLEEFDTEGILLKGLQVLPTNGLESHASETHASQNLRKMQVATN